MYRPKPVTVYLGLSVSEESCETVDMTVAMSNIKSDIEESRTEREDTLPYFRVFTIRSGVLGEINNWLLSCELDEDAAMQATELVKEGIGLAKKYAREHSPENN